MSKDKAKEQTAEYLRKQLDKYYEENYHADGKPRVKLTFVDKFKGWWDWFVYGRDEVELNAISPPKVSGDGKRRHPKELWCVHHDASTEDEVLFERLHESARDYFLDIKAITKDARRYRWLRRGNTDRGEGTLFVAMKRGIVCCFVLLDLDEAIDREMEAENEKCD
jgi:hypothetical protein